MLYRIRQISTGLFFAGSGYKKKTWTANGKIYTSRGLASSSIRAAIRQGGGGWDGGIDPADIEIVEYEVRETQSFPLDS